MGVEEWCVRQSVINNYPLLSHHVLKKERLVTKHKTYEARIYLLHIALEAPSQVTVNQSQLITLLKSKASIIIEYSGDTYLELLVCLLYIKTLS